MLTSRWARQRCYEGIARPAALRAEDFPPAAGVKAPAAARESDLQVSRARGRATELVMMDLVSSSRTCLEQTMTVQQPGPRPCPPGAP